MKECDKCYHGEMCKWQDSLNRDGCESFDDGYRWVPINEDDPDSFPPVDEDGYSDYILISFENAGFLCIGQYRTDEEGGAFYEGDDAQPLTKWGLFVNAWQKLQGPYREGE